MPAASRASIEKRIANYHEEAKRYDKEKGDIKKQAEGYDKDYDRLNIHDDQLALALSPNNFGTVTSFMSLLLLVPAALACLIPYVMIVGLTVGVKRLNLWLPDRFATTRTILHRANYAAQELAHRVASPFIWISQRFAWLERFVGGKPPKAFPITPTSVIYER